MGLADRDYMRSPASSPGRTTRLDDAPNDGIIWEATARRPRSATGLRRPRRLIASVLWLAGGTAVFTALWAIGCAIIGAQWHGQGRTFTLSTAQGEPHRGDNHGVR